MLSWPVSIKILMSSSLNSLQTRLPQCSLRPPSGPKLKFLPQTKTAAPQAPVANFQPSVRPPPQNAWSRSGTALYSEATEPQESYIKDGVIELDEEEAQQIRTEYDLALIGRVVGKNFLFDWLSRQLYSKWGGMEGF